MTLYKIAYFTKIYLFRVFAKEMANLSTDIELDELGIFDHPNLTGTPERRLLLAILERALLDYVGNDEKEALEASEWIFTELPHPPYGEFSFPWICEQLDLNIDEILAKIRMMPKRGDSRLAPWYLTKTKAAA